jgi:hypothetical protein
MRDGLAASITLAVAAVLAVMMLEAWALPDMTTLGLREIVGMIVLGSCTWFTCERTERSCTYMHSNRPITR